VAGQPLPKRRKGLIMMKIRFVIAVLVTVGLAGAPFAAEAKKHHRIMHTISTQQSATYGSLGVPTTQSGTYGASSTYGTSGTSVGTVTAPSVGSYNWPSVGVTNAVPTWSNTGPRVR
jgi:hypothetical protein